MMPTETETFEYDPVEDKTYDFLQQKITGFSIPIFAGIELHDTLYQKITTDSGIRISEAVSDFSPDVTNKLQEFDALLTLVVYSKILGANKSERRQARKKAFNIAVAVAKLFFDDFTMSGRVCDSRVLEAVRGWDSINGQPYAVVNMPVVFNASGAINFDKRR